jgi:hypothetical protein
MNKKGQMTIGIIMITFITILVGVILFQEVETLTSPLTDTMTVKNYTFTAAAANTSVDLPGQELMGTFEVQNSTGGGVPLDSANYIIAEGVSPRTGTKRILFTSVVAAYGGASLNASYTAGPEGYADDSGTRSIIPLIGIMMAMAIAIVALIPTLRSKVLEMMGR